MFQATIIYVLKQGQLQTRQPKKKQRTPPPGPGASQPPLARQHDSKRSLNDVVTWCRCPRRYPGNAKSRDESFVENYGQKILILKQIDRHMLIVGNIKYI